MGIVLLVEVGLSHIPRSTTRGKVFQYSAGIMGSLEPEAQALRPLKLPPTTTITIYLDIVLYFAVATESLRLAFGIMSLRRVWGFQLIPIWLKLFVKIWTA